MAWCFYILKPANKRRVAGLGAAVSAEGCVHHWVLSSGGSVAFGRCKKCELERSFPNVWGEDVTIGRVSPTYLGYSELMFNPGESRRARLPDRISFA